MSDMSVVSESGEKFPLTQRIRSLQEEHSQLEEALAEQEARPMPDSLTIASLKRRKLAIKDELAALTET
jgi:hypothetical protein